MSNDYFNFASPLVEHQTARAGDINAIARAIAAGFDKLPAPNGLASGAGGYGLTTGTATAYVLQVTPNLPDLVPGARVRMMIHATNTGAPTLNVSGLGVRQIRDAVNNPLVPGALMADSIAVLDYDGVAWRVQNMTVAATIAGFGVGAVGGATPLLRDFHDTTIGAGFYRWDSTNTLNYPGVGGGTAHLTYRGNGLAHWSAWRVAGSDNEPVEWQKATNGTPNNWSPWRRDVERGNVAGRGDWIRIRGGLQICAGTIDPVRISTTTIGVAWTFPQPFITTPWFLGGTLPNTTDGTYTNCAPEDFGGVSVQRTSGAQAPEIGTFYWRKAGGGILADAKVTNATVFAVGRWY